MSGTLEHSAGKIVQQLIIDLGLGSDPSGSDPWPVYVSNKPDEPDNLITCLDTMGIHQGRIQVSGEVQERNGVQIIVRSQRFPGGWTKARALAVSLDEDVLRTAVIVETTEYLVQGISRTSGPIALGKETEEGSDTPITKRQQFSINTTISVRVSP